MLHVAHIGVGSNLGDRQANIAAAIERLRGARGIAGVQPSSVYETEPVGGPAQGPYLNAAARIDTTLDALGLLRLLLSIEASLGRVRAERWGPRTIDLDLLLFDREVIHTPELILPHPHLHERRFVLEPLAEIAPGALHPTLGKNVYELLQSL